MNFQLDYSVAARRTRPVEVVVSNIAVNGEFKTSGSTDPLSAPTSASYRVRIANLCLIASKDCRVKFIAFRDSTEVDLSGFIPLVAGSGFVLTDPEMAFVLPVGYGLRLAVRTYDDTQSVSNLRIGGWITEVL